VGAVKIKDTGFTSYRAAFKELDSKKVAVGLFAKVGDEVLTKGVVNEFGTTKAGKNHDIVIPERSFIRSTYNKNYKKVSRRFGQIAKSIGDGNFRVTDKLRLIGVEQEAAIKKTMVDLKIPPNAASTIAKKGSSNPLIDTGETREKISSELRGANE
tara:strand:- start:1146 stop:1613 length:468 start_codon:yes stop_codon:yes gene_type:complete